MTKDSSLRPLDSYTGFLLFRAGREVTNRIEQALVTLGITIRHNGIMTLLAGEPMSQIALVERLGVDRTTMVSIIDELEEMGFVTRGRHPQDRRAHLVTLTETGRAMVAKAQERITAAEEVAFAEFSPTDLLQLRSFLLHLIARTE